MKTFQDLEFKPHPTGEGLSSKLFFPNGYGISVVRFLMPFGGGYGSYTDNDDEWEAAILRGKAKNWEIDYKTGISEDVLGHLSDLEVTDLMEKIQKLPKS